MFGRTDVVKLCARLLVLCNLSAGIPLCEKKRFGCVENSYVVRPPVPQEVEPWNMAGTISCADPTARFPCIINTKKCATAACCSTHAPDADDLSSRVVY